MVEWGIGYEGITLAARVLVPFAPDELPNFLTNYVRTVGSQRLAQALALANPDFPPLYVLDVDVTSSPPHFPYGIPVEPDEPE